MTGLEVLADPRPERDVLDALWQAAWGGDYPADPDVVHDRSLVHLCAYDGGHLVGYVNVASDGGLHAFLLDPTVHPDHRHRGLGTRLVNEATVFARSRGAAWLHVDFLPHLEPFYRACGFLSTSAGLIRL